MLMTKLLLGCCFHSIGFPSEWGRLETKSIAFHQPSFHSIGFPSEWGQHSSSFLLLIHLWFPFNWFPQRVGTFATWDNQAKKLEGGFHSIGFPSEWGRTQQVHLLQR